jgi:hypothetical protein
MFKEQVTRGVVDRLPSSSVDIKNMVEPTATCITSSWHITKVTNGTKLFEMDRNGKNKNNMQKWFSW